MKADLVLQWLQDEGYKHQVDEDGDVPFRYEGKGMYFFPDEDESFFRLAIPNVYECESEEDHVRILEVCNSLNKDYKVLKVFLVNQKLWFAIEMFIDNTPNLNDFFDRCCHILAIAYDEGRKMIMGS